MVYPVFFHFGSQNTSCSSVCAWPTNKKPIRSQDEHHCSRIVLLHLLFKFTWKATKSKKHLLCLFVNTLSLGFNFIARGGALCIFVSFFFFFRDSIFWSSFWFTAKLNVKNRNLQQPSPHTWIASTRKVHLLQHRH